MVARMAEMITAERERRVRRRRGGGGRDLAPMGGLKLVDITVMVPPSARRACDA